ncbi:MAG: di-trans,poly-cis-decaprenylcistransferase [Deltaproteobacteria bacterium]|nr:di-trans,poly-cis-decaprenylcistransferase [Deltaproteobacteria bacterium]
MSPLPTHVAIIMDGNGRWAESHRLPRIEGHRKGVEVSEEIITASRERGIRYLTLYAFSEENWNRPQEEVIALIAFLKQFLREKCPKMMREGIRFRAIGNTDRFPDDVQDEIRRTTEATRDGKGMTLILALSYGARQEICSAVETLIGQGVHKVTPEILSEALDTRGIPDPDLLIRTSGEYRISNFLLWQLAYTELYFTKTLWPDFHEEEFVKALDAYARRERRFGMTSQQLQRKKAV